GVNVEAALDKLKDIKISIHCWQGDDIEGFLFNQELSGGISVTGNYPGKARNGAELRSDLEEALKHIPGNHKINLHSIYAERSETIDLDEAYNVDTRSEEHTSELQSRFDLVCRLLLEQKKI